MHDYRLSEAEADEGLGLSDGPTEVLTGGSHEIPHPPELQSPPPLSTPTPPPARSPGRTVRELARKLSQQNLRRSEYSTSTDQRYPAPPQLDPLTSAPEPTPISQPPPPPIPATSQDFPTLPDFSTPQPWPCSLEVDDEPEAADDTSKHDPPYLSLLSLARRRSQFFRGESSSMGGGEVGGSRSTGARLRKQMSSQFREKTITTNTARVEQMISSGTQCNVQNVPPPPPRATTPAPIPPSSTASVAPPKPEANNLDYVYSPMELEVDEAYCNGSESFEDDLSFVESIASLRRAGGPGGIRKQIVNGIPLRYQLSADAALRCQTVVKNRPRMRKRKKTRTESMASSAATSAISSPVIPPSIPSPHLHPYQ